jgi:hypothetical protein
MILTAIIILLAIALALIWSIFASRGSAASDQAGVLHAWHSDYKQLRIECHRSIDKSVSPPK